LHTEGILTEYLNKKLIDYDKITTNSKHLKTSLDVARYESDKKLNDQNNICESIK